MIYYIVAISLLSLILIIAYKGVQRQQLNDSVLKRRALMSLNEQQFYTQLKQALPQFNILVNVSFDRLLTTKLLRTRHKYQSMVADFVILDEHYQVVAVIAFSGAYPARRHHEDLYQDQLLQLANYRVLRYAAVPETHELREQLINSLIIRLDQRVNHYQKPQAAFQIEAAEQVKV